MKKFFLLFAASAMLLSFVSCSNGDDDDSTSNDTTAVVDNSSSTDSSSSSSSDSSSSSSSSSSATANPFTGNKYVELTVGKDSSIDFFNFTSDTAVSYAGTDYVYEYDDTTITLYIKNRNGKFTIGTLTYSFNSDKSVLTISGTLTTGGSISGTYTKQ